MSILDYQAFVLPLLCYASDGKEHETSDVLITSIDQSFEDAYYFHVAYSGSVHYLIQKCQRFGISLDAQLPKNDKGRDHGN